MVQVSLAMRLIKLSMRHSWLLRFLLCSLSTALTCTKGSQEPNCDTCGSNGNPIIPFLGKRPVLTRQQHLSQSFNINVDQSFDIKVFAVNFKHPDPQSLFGRDPFILQLPKTHATNQDQSSPPSLVPHPRSRTH